MWRDCGVISEDCRYLYYNKQLGYNGLSLPTIAEILYNEERKYQLMLLCELLQVCRCYFDVSFYKY